MRLDRPGDDASRGLPGAHRLRLHLDGLARLGLLTCGIERLRLLLQPGEGIGIDDADAGVAEQLLVQRHQGGVAREEPRDMRVEVDNDGPVTILLDSRATPVADR